MASNIISFDGFPEEIRMTEDGRYSVYDVIKFCGKKNPRDSWSDLSRQFPEVVTKTDNLKFPGPGQRETPVAGREGILYIIGLLPGSIGRAYRQEAAKIFLQFIDASPELAESIIDRAKPEDLERIEARLKSKQIRVSFTAVLQDHGVNGIGYGLCTNAIYIPVLGGDAKQIKLAKGLGKNDNIRDNLDLFELASVGFAEALASRNIKKANAQGNNQCQKITEDSAKKVRATFD